MFSSDEMYKFVSLQFLNIVSSRENTAFKRLSGRGMDLFCAEYHSSVRSL